MSIDDYTVDVPQNQIVINSVYDLPTPVDLGDGLGTAHRLGTGLYLLGADLTLAYPLAPPATADQKIIIRGMSHTNINYTGTGAYIRANATNKWLRIMHDDVRIIGDGSNTFVAMLGTGAETFMLNLCRIDSFDSLGMIESQFVYTTYKGIFTDFGGRLTLKNNTINYLSVVSTQTSSPIGDAHIRIEGTSLSTGLDSMQMIPLSGDSAFDIDAAYLGSLNMAGCNIITAYGGTAFKTGSLNQKTPLVIAHANRGIPNSRVLIDQHVRVSEGSAPTTSFTALNQPVPIVNTFTYGNTERFTGATDGRMTYTGFEEHHSIMHSAYTIVQSSAGVNQKYAIIPAIENPTNMLVTAISDPGGGNIDITTNNPHGLSVGDRLTLFDMTDAGYDATYTVGTVVSTTVVRVPGTFAATETGDWRCILENESKEIELDFNVPASVGMSSSIDNLQTGDIVLVVVEATTGDYDDTLKFFSLNNILN